MTASILTFMSYVLIALFCYVQGQKSGRRNEEMAIIKLKLKHGPAGLVEYSDSLRFSAHHAKHMEYLKRIGYGNAEYWKTPGDKT